MLIETVNDCAGTIAAMGDRMKPCTLLMEMQKGLATLENSFFKKRKKTKEEEEEKKEEGGKGEGSYHIAKHLCPEVFVLKKCVYVPIHKAVCETA